MSVMTRRALLRSGLRCCLVIPWLNPLEAIADQSAPQANPSDQRTASGLTDTEIILGVSAAFSGPSRGLGIELWRGASAYFTHVNRLGGVAGRKVRLKTYDDGYQPDPSVRNTMQLMLQDQVFLLFGYVGTPTVTRVLPMLKKFQDRNILLFFPFTGAQPQREPPYGDFAFNLRASYRQETAGLVDNFVRIKRRRLAVFYQADAYGRSGWAGVRRAPPAVRGTDCRRGNLPPGRTVHRQHAQAGRNIEGVRAPGGNLYRLVCGLRGLCA